MNAASPSHSLDGVPLHIVQRGHNREPCFFAEEGYHSYRHWLGEALSDTGCQWRAYALMTNHVHLLVTPGKAEVVPKLIIALGAASAIHQHDLPPHRHVVGQSLQVLADPGRKLFALLLRSIELNPVRAAMVDDSTH